MPWWASLDWYVVAWFVADGAFMLYGRSQAAAGDSWRSTAAVVCTVLAASGLLIAFAVLIERSRRLMAASTPHPSLASLILGWRSAVLLCTILFSQASSLLRQGA